MLCMTSSLSGESFLLCRQVESKGPFLGVIAVTLYPREHHAISSAAVDFTSILCSTALISLFRDSGIDRNRVRDVYLVEGPEQS